MKIGAGVLLEYLRKLSMYLKIMNSKIEEYILSNPENYLWFHRRFKNRPESEAPFYPSDLLRKRT